MTATLLEQSEAHAVAARLTDHLPLPGLTAHPAAVAPERLAGARAVAATFVGSRSAELVLAFTGDELVSIGEGAPLASPLDVLRPALERASDLLGDGVLGELREATAVDVLGEGATVFELTGEGRTVGWFAVRLRDRAAAAATDVSSRLGRISSVEMALTVEIGRTRMSVRDLLSLEPGSVVELDRSVGTPADVLVNGRLIARGEVVVVDQDYAVRITSILDTADGVR
ncbi:flagellar motor switch protein FliN/FliY [Diaminobutyricimonas aerilata]|uniref:Flagellar motor switch protein FliN/FliY n=1 Tax=Diaminobutyricimonas aerilata TaxID=1162967 RepID=A0A2M9CMZ4_9MICO|nr:flagellar motor switch protein FliN [Diaminobutyricimonas aerilata]PJJ73277.1 flagellar motor switch protein FliN/FliY [Diaminobutyricimonas aerilata]